MADKTCYSPFDTTIDVDGVATWTNDDTTLHTIHGGTPYEADYDGPFAILLAGDEYSFKYEEPGTFPYFCVVHPWMDGTVTVTGTAEPSPKDTDMQAGQTTAQVSITGGVTPDEPCVTAKTCYSPFDVLTGVGGVVTWTNDDTTLHTVHGGTPFEADYDGPFAILLAGDEYSFKYEEPGTFPYFCVVHPWMNGTVTVIPEVSSKDTDMLVDFFEYVDIKTSDVTLLVDNRTVGLVLSDYARLFEHFNVSLTYYVDVYDVTRASDFIIILTNDFDADTISDSAKDKQLYVVSSREPTIIDRYAYVGDSFKLVYAIDVRTCI